MQGVFPAIRAFLFGSPPPAAAPPSKNKRLRARYDIAQTGRDNAAQWAGADGLDADAANSPGVRLLARNRSRTETQNNPTLTGIVRTICDYEVGTGPTLHVDHEDESFAGQVEQKWREWCEAVNLPAKLRQMVYGRVVDGESFARIGANPDLKNEVQLDIQPFECDRCYTLWLPYLTPYRIDGVWFDTWGNPTYYDILQYHPGGVFPMPTWKFDTVPAQYVLHLFAPERANQHRGMPEMISSTELFADRRRFRKATIGAAEGAANITGFLTTDQPAEDGFAPEENSVTAFPRNSLVVAPNQYDLKQIDAKHPNQTYEMFATETLNEAARPVSMALNVAKCDSSRYNFSGGRLDIITSWKAVEVRQANTTHRVVYPLFKAWYAEARLVFGWQTQDGGKVPAHAFLWVGMPYSDPEAEQTADEDGIATGTKGIQAVYARRGLDWTVERRKNARALSMSEDAYTQWILGNLTRGKGGDQSATQGAGVGVQGSETREPRSEEGETPEQVKARWRAYHRRVLARMNRSGTSPRHRRLRAGVVDDNNHKHDDKGLFAPDTGGGSSSGGQGRSEPGKREAGESGHAGQGTRDRATLLEHREFLEGKPVASIKGDEIPAMPSDAEGRKQWIQSIAQRFAAARQSRVKNPEIGDVILNAKGVRRSISHGTGPEKNAAFAAVPDIIRHGKVLDRAPAKKDPRVTVVTIGAPIQLKGDNYAGIVIVRKAPNGQWFNLHEVFAIKMLQAGRHHGVPAGAGEQPHAKSGAINRLLRRIFSVKEGDA
jgi:capsid protein